MPVFLDNPYNPNPISKLMVTFLLGFAVFHKVNIYFEWAIILLISFLFYNNGFKKEALKNILRNKQQAVACMKLLQVLRA